MSYDLNNTVNYVLFGLNIVSIFFNFCGMLITLSKTKKTRPDYLLVFYKVVIILVLLHTEINVLGQRFFSTPKIDMTNYNRYVYSVFITFLLTFNFQIISEIISFFFDPFEIIIYLLNSVKSVMFDYYLLFFYVILVLTIEITASISATSEAISNFYIILKLDFAGFSDKELSWIIFSFNPIVILLAVAYFIAFLTQMIDFFRLSSELKLKPSHMKLFSCVKALQLITSFIILFYLTVFVIVTLDIGGFRTKSSLLMGIFTVIFYVYLLLESILITLTLAYSDHFFFVYGFTKLGRLISGIFCIPVSEDEKPVLSTSSIRISKFNPEESVTYIQDISGLSVETHQISLINSYADLCLNSILRILPQLIVLSRDNRQFASSESEKKIDLKKAKINNKDFYKNNVVEYEFTIQDLINNKPTRVFNFNEGNNRSNSSEGNEITDNKNAKENKTKNFLYASVCTPYVTEILPDNPKVVKRTSDVTKLNDSYAATVTANNNANANNVTDMLHEQFLNRKNSSHTEIITNDDITKNNSNQLSNSNSDLNRTNISNKKSSIGKVKIKSIYQTKLELASLQNDNFSFTDELELLRKAINDQIVNQPQFILYLISKNKNGAMSAYSDLKFTTDNGCFNIQFIDNKKKALTYLESYISYKKENTRKVSLLEDVIAFFEFQIGNFPGRIVVITKNKFISPQLIPKEYYHMWQIIRLSPDFEKKFKKPYMIVSSSHSKDNKHNTNDILATIEKANSFKQPQNNTSDCEDDSFNSNFIKNPNEVVLQNDHFKIINYEYFENTFHADIEFLKKQNIGDVSLTLLYYELGKLEKEEDERPFSHIPTPIPVTVAKGNNKANNNLQNENNLSNNNFNNANANFANNNISFNKFTIRLSNISKNFSGIMRNKVDCVLESSSDEDLLKELEENSNKNVNCGFPCNAFKASIIDYQCVLFFYIDIHDFSSHANSCGLWQEKNPVMNLSEAANSEHSKTYKQSFICCTWLFIERIKSIGFYFFDFLFCRFTCMKKNRLSQFNNFVLSKFKAAFHAVEISS